MPGISAHFPLLLRHLLGNACLDISKFALIFARQICVFVCVLFFRGLRGWDEEDASVSGGGCVGEEMKKVGTYRWWCAGGGTVAAVVARVG